MTELTDGRRRIMRSVRSTETRPERLLRSLLHRSGYRFRKNVRGLPGRPDIVFSRRKKAVFVHGCFWHQHQDCSKAITPKVRTEYWGPKLRQNVVRDEAHLTALQRLGWETLVIWECELSMNPTQQLGVVKAFIGCPRA